MRRGSTTSIALLLALAACSTTPTVADSTRTVEAAASALGDDYPAPVAASAGSAVGGQADGLAAELVGDLGAWDANDRAGRLRAAESVATKYPDLRFDRIEELSDGNRTREIAVFRIRGPLSHEEFVLVPGWIQGGATRTVRVRPFLVSRRELRVETWDRVMTDDVGADGLAELRGVSWLDATRFCMRARVELPTEAEWEHAFRAGEPGGVAAADRFAAGWSSRRPATPYMTSGPVNGLGLQGAVDGAWEWTETVGAAGAVARGGATSGAARIVVGLNDAVADVGLRPIFRIHGPFPYPAERR